MQAAIAVWLGMLYVVLLGDQKDVVLFEQAVSHDVDIFFKGADDADARNVVEVFLHRLQRYRKPAALELLGDALWRFEAALYGVDGVIGAAGVELRVEDVELGLYLHQGALVKRHDLLEFFWVVQKHVLTFRGAARIRRQS